MFGHAAPTPGRVDAQEVLDETEADYTPEGVVVQLLLALRECRPNFRPRLALDPAAGSGVWGRAMRAVFGGELLVAAVEKRKSEADNLARAYRWWTIGSALGEGPRVLLRRAGARGFDFSAGNPPFSAFEDDGWADNFRERELLEPGALVAFYGLSQWGQSKEAATTLKRWSPSLQLRVGGRVEHRGVGTYRWAPIPKKRRVPGGPTHEWRKNGGDSREYCLWVWDLADYGRKGRPRWQAEQLPILPRRHRCWLPDEVPGTRPIDHRVVDLIRRRYL